jgi:hypothetical protein
MSNQEEQARSSQPEIPEFYANSFFFTCSVWDAHLEFGLRPVIKGETQPPEAQVIVRMSKEMAWVICKLMNRVLKDYMHDVGVMSLSQDLLEQLELEDEYRADREYIEARQSQGGPR